MAALAPVFVRITVVKTFDGCFSARLRQNYSCENGRWLLQRPSSSELQLRKRPMAAPAPVFVRITVVKTFDGCSSRPSSSELLLRKCSMAAPAPVFVRITVVKTFDGCSSARLRQNYSCENVRWLLQRPSSPELLLRKRSMAAPAPVFVRITVVKTFDGSSSARLRQNYSCENVRWWLPQQNSPGLQKSEEVPLKDSGGSQLHGYYFFNQLKKKPPNKDDLSHVFRSKL